jgi:hypothetical protein
MRVTTSQKFHFLLSVFLLLAFFLPGCGPSQTEIDATATQYAEEEFATLTAQAPTATLTPTVTPTHTATPTSTPTITPSPTSTPVPTDTQMPTPAPPVEMEPFVTFSTDFTYGLEYPKEWEHEIKKVGDGEVISVAVSPDQSVVLEIYEANLEVLGFGSTTLEEYVDFQINYLPEVDSSFQLMSREQIISRSGLPVELLVFTIKNGDITGNNLMYVRNEETAINLTFLSVTNVYEDYLPIIEYTFDVFEVSE